MSTVFYLSIIVFLVVCAMLCFVILIQESKSSGLGASFGGDSGSAVFGTSTASVLKKFTAWLAVIFFSLCIILSLWTEALGRSEVHVATPTELVD